MHRNLAICFEGGQKKRCRLQQLLGYITSAMHYIYTRMLNSGCSWSWLSNTLSPLDATAECILYIQDMNARVRRCELSVEFLYWGSMPSIIACQVADDIELYMCWPPHAMNSHSRKLPGRPILKGVDIVHDILTGNNNSKYHPRL